MAVKTRSIENSGYTVFRMDEPGKICAYSRVFPANRPGRTCAQLNGTERTMPTRNFVSQELEYRTFCLPNLLVEYY